MHKILMSACLFGEFCRYDGKSNEIDNKIMYFWKEDKRIIPVCPEVFGGLPIPRDPGEIRDGKVISCNGEDYTEAFEKGAREALRLAKEHDVVFAILKENSPSCGSHEVYDGTFSGNKVFGQGIAARLLMDNGITVYNEHQIIEAFKELEEIEFEDLICEQVLSVRV